MRRGEDSGGARRPTARRGASEKVVELGAGEHAVSVGIGLVKQLCTNGRERWERRWEAM